jgi:excisionase family DNA binding protein
MREVCPGVDFSSDDGQRTGERPVLENALECDPVHGRLALTVSEVASLLGIGQTLAWKLVRSGEIPSRHIGRTVRVPAAALMTYLAAR